MITKLSFLLTHLLRGATGEQNILDCISHISTHAPLARCNLTVLLLYQYFLISTHAPLARCNNFTVFFKSKDVISTHAPPARCNGICTRSDDSVRYFYSRTSCEVQQEINGDPATSTTISTHAPPARCNE